ncbi:MAG: esterase/lipase family protein [Gammaproteobacteria bacterium]
MAATPTQEATGEPVVLLHGLKRSRYSMKKIEKYLVRSGYNTCNINYPSNRKPVTELVEFIGEDIKRCFADDERPVNFVTHSMGGIMVRALAESQHAPNIGRVVMLAPPNKGSEIVDLHRSSKMFRWIMGDVATQLGTDVNSLPLRLGPAKFNVGIIAGDGLSNPMGLWVFDEPSDGTVAVRSTRLEGMDDFIVVPFGHTLIMRKRQVIEEVLHYLENGRFSPKYREGPIEEST